MHFVRGSSLAFSSRVKKTRDSIVVASVFVVCALGLYGAWAWYFPARWLSSTLAAGLVVASLYYAIRLTPFSAHPGLLRTFEYLLVLLAASFLLWVSIGLGVPAILMSFMGPNETVSTIVLEKEHGFRSCSRRVLLSEFSAPIKEKICVSASLYGTLREGQRVSLLVRRGVLGTRVFEIDPS
jgi:hypothetical protein